VRAGRHDSEDSREIEMAKHVILKDKEEASNGFGEMAAMEDGVCNGIIGAYRAYSAHLACGGSRMRCEAFAGGRVQPCFHGLLRYSVDVACVSCVAARCRATNAQPLLLCLYLPSALPPPSVSVRAIRRAARECAPSNFRRPP
jgi:hypothetical protein